MADFSGFFKKLKKGDFSAAQLAKQRRERAAREAAKKKAKASKDGSKRKGY